MTANTGMFYVLSPSNELVNSAVELGVIHAGLHIADLFMTSRYLTRADFVGLLYELDSRVAKLYGLTVSSNPANVFLDAMTRGSYSGHLEDILRFRSLVIRGINTTTLYVSDEAVSKLLFIDNPLNLTVKQLKLGIESARAHIKSGGIDYV